MIKNLSVHFDIQVKVSNRLNLDFSLLFAFEIRNLFLTYDLYLDYSNSSL